MVAGSSDRPEPGAVPEPGDQPADRPPPPVVAIGASAGGLEAIEQFFAAVRAPSRFAFVVVQHLSPDFQSLMLELLAKRTALLVRSVADGTTPAANTIHLIPAGRTMTLEGGRFRLAEPDARELLHHPIDEFFVSLASDRGPAAIGVVLSGSGSDGSRGARAIRAAGGRVLVQQPKSAPFSSMPQAAIEAGCSDEVMAPDAMAQALAQAQPRAAAPAAPPTAPDSAGTLPPALVACLDQAFGIDFSAYRPATLQHRVNRRMMLRGFDRLDAYTSLVVDDPDEQEALYHDLLIGPTRFFRDDAAFAALAREAAPELAARLDAGQEVRVWVPACATGEEAYSIAILVLAHTKEPLDSRPLVLFATDIHRRSLAIAEAGFYSQEAVAEVRPEWRQRFFTRRGSGWQIAPAVRRTISFAAHDLLREPPFADLLLISCRNLASALVPEVRDRMLESFARALLPGGHLLLGQDESAAHLEASFAALDAAVPLYRKKRDAKPSERGSVVASALPAAGPPLTVALGRPVSRERRDQRLTMAHERLLDRYVPPSLLVDEAGQVIHCFGDAGAYLERPSGRPSLAVLDMVKEPLRAPLAAAINRVKRSGRPLALADLALAPGPDAPVLRHLVVEALSGQRCLLVSFDDRQPAANGAAAEPAPDEMLPKATIHDLEAADETLRQRVQELESLVDSLGLAALFLDPGLGIRRYTAAATRYFDLRPEDVGRPLDHVAHHFAQTDLAALLRAAAAAGSPARHDLEAADGATVRLALVPQHGPDQAPAGIAVAIHDRKSFPDRPPPPS